MAAKLEQINKMKETVFKKYKNKRIGKEFKHKISKEKYKIIGYNNANDITIQYDKGLILYGLKYCHIKEGKIANKSKENEINLRILKSYYHHSTFEEFKIINYINYRNIIIQFNDGTIVENCKFDHIESGYIKNPNNKNNILYLENKDKYNLNIKFGKFYAIWSNIKDRINDKDKPTYDNSTISDEWLIFDNFKNWCIENYVSNWKLDKDLLILNNKIYSSKTCCFLPELLNVQFKKYPKIKNIPLGVIYKNNNWKINLNNKEYPNIFNTSEEAFNFYLKEKLNYIKKLNNQFKNELKENVYNKINSLTIQQLEEIIL